MAEFSKLPKTITKLEQIPPANEHGATEAEFCAAWVEARDAKNDYLYSKFIVFVHGSAVLLAYLLAHPELKPIMMAVHAILFCTSAASFIQGYRGKSSPGVYALAWCIFSCGYIYMLRHSLMTAPLEDTLILATMVLGICSLQGLLIPNYRYMHYLVTAVTLTFGTLAMSEHTLFAKWAAVFISFCATTFGVGLTQRRTLFAEARREFMLRSTMLPSNMILKSAAAQDSMDSVFKPERRYCVCISSDWRNYQALTAQYSAEDLAHVLSKYYQLCQQTISQLLPAGNYYLDWIADELFLVVFAKDEKDEGRMVNQALEFAVKLVVTKQAFMAEYGLPGAIDIGISGGAAHVGLMGPKGNMKATALGEIPGRARRLQACGKLLRANFGETDRIIFGVDSLMKISAGFPVHQYGIQDDVILKDLKDKTLYFIEPKAAEEKLAQTPNVRAAS